MSEDTRNKLIELGIGVAFVVFMAGLMAHAQELPPTPQPQHIQQQTWIMHPNGEMGPANGYVYPVTHAKSHAKRNMILAGITSAVAMGAVIYVEHKGSAGSPDADIHKPVILAPR